MTNEQLEAEVTNLLKARLADAESLESLTKERDAARIELDSMARAYEKLSTEFDGCRKDRDEAQRGVQGVALRSVVMDQTEKPEDAKFLEVDGGI